MVVDTVWTTARLSRSSSSCEVASDLSLKAALIELQSMDKCVARHEVRCSASYAGSQLHPNPERKLKHDLRARAKHEREGKPGW